tara:strand:+ start:1670 stop:1963 length:294 start_codon:yes stop_codon:yes gene_type:complete
MKIYFFKYLSRPILLIILLFPSILLRSNFLYAEYVLEELQIDTSTKTEGDNSAIPTNPFEIVEMIRRQNSLNDATNPTDAIDDALESFNNLEEKKEI